jgi:CheY-like chemotaxis protein
MSDCLAVALETRSRSGVTVTTKAISVRVLLVSGDTQTIDTLCHFMERMAMHVEVCSDISSATRKLCRGKFEAVVVDFKNPAETLELIKTPREMTSHKGVVVLAILNSSNDMPDAFRAGANFALVRPLLTPILMRTLRAAYPLMVQERRRYYRCPVQLPIHISGVSRDFVGKSVNISEGGMALITSVPLRVGENINLRLTLPGAEGTATMSSEVCWTDNAGRVGLVFVEVPATVLEQLQTWLAGRLAECQPC